ncbi:hypothetical protein ONZ45_g17760 [Pleurotus djamor]|nr:hypothetical protein ONZ45_g17760 [Pleurotus djamor]
MSFVNEYKPAPPQVLTTEPQEKPYDINFAFPLPVDALQTSKLKLVPFIPWIHAEPFYNAAKKSPDTYRWLPFTFPTIEDFLDHSEHFRSQPGYLILAMIDKAKLLSGAEEADCVAGMIGFIGMSTAMRTAELGPVIVLPEYQRTYVSTHAIGIALRYILDVPATLENPDSYGLGFRRVQWTANPANIGSVRCAERMGLKMEAPLIRWTWCLGEEKEGTAAPEERGGGKGRNSSLLAVTWEDWENGVRDHVTKLMDRK